MRVLSESERLFRRQAGQTLEALPSLRRWLLRSRPERQGREGGQAIPLSHVRVLVHLYQRGPVPMGKLAGGLGISCSTATECVAALEARGRVMRRRSPTDRRLVLVSLTPEAEAVAEQVHSQRLALVEGALRQLTPLERRAFVKGLGLLATGAETWMDAAPSGEVREPSAEKEAALA